MLILWVFPVVVLNYKEQVVLNFGISYRSSIRRAPSVIMWVQVLRKLVKKGLTTWAQLIKEWNGQCSKSNQIVGQKAVAVKLMIELLPESWFELVVAHVSWHGWHHGAYSDDSLGSKKLVPGTKIKLPGGQVVVVTEVALLLMARNVDADWKGRRPLV